MGRSDGGLLGPQHLPAAEADRIASGVIKVQRDAIGQLLFVAPCGCTLVLDPGAWSPLHPDGEVIQAAVKARFVQLVDHVLRGSPCPEVGHW